jgi:hypothetical protein
MTGDVGGQKRGLHGPDRLPESAPVAIPVFGQLEQELPVVAALGQMVNPSRQNGTIGPRHAAELSGPPETIQPRKPSRKLTHAGHFDV